MLEREPPAAQPAGVDRTRRHRADPAGPPRQQSQGSRITGHVPGDDLPQDPPVRDQHASQLTCLSRVRSLSGPAEASENKGRPPSPAEAVTSATIPPTFNVIEDR